MITVEESLCKAGRTENEEWAMSSTAINVVLVLADSQKLSIQAGNGLRGTFPDVGWQQY